MKNPKTTNTRCSRKSVYIQDICPRIQRFKFDCFGHDQIVLHERDIAKNIGPFAALRRPNRKEATANVMMELGRIIEEAEFSVIASVIDKRRKATGA